MPMKRATTTLQVPVCYREHTSSGEIRDRDDDDDDSTIDDAAKEDYSTCIGYSLIEGSVRGGRDPQEEGHR